jgi:putative transcriptional regulator
MIQNTSYNGNLTGKIIISTPSTVPESYFAKSVIYILRHNNDGTIGLVINNPITFLPSNLRIKNLWKQGGEEIKLEKIRPYAGGPVEIEKGFILHSNDYESNVLEKNKAIYLSSNINVLRDIALGKGPKNSIFLFGYCGWSQGQLENELKNNMWILVEQDTDLIFKTADKLKWYNAINQLKINPSYYSNFSGSC